MGWTKHLETDLQEVTAQQQERGQAQHNFMVEVRKKSSN
jgi:hypothetical protein